MFKIFMCLLVIVGSVYSQHNDLQHSENDCKKVVNRGCERRDFAFEPPPNNPRPRCKNRSCAGGGSFV
jgi:hypothetical protein